MVAESSTTSAAVSARLRWTRGFVNSDAGSYQCVVREPNTSVELEYRNVRLKAARPIHSPPSPLSCDTCESPLIYFQIRVFPTDCERWEEQQGLEISSRLSEYLLSVVRTKCNCQVDKSELEVIGSPQCSSKVIGAAVFSGRIKAGLRTHSQRIYCVLFEWQRSGALVRINDHLRAVDDSCHLKVSSSNVNNEECIAVTEIDNGVHLPTVGAITSGIVGGILLIILLEIVFCCMYKMYDKYQSCN